MAETIHLTCPECGNTLEVPAALEEFSCMYCGKRARTATVKAMNESAGSAYEEIRAELREKLPEAVIKYPDYHRKITKKEFFPAFEAYEKENTPLLEQLDVCARLCPGQTDKCMRQIAEDLLDELEAYMQKDPRWNKKNGRSNLMFEVKVVLAIFMTPLVRKLKLASAEAFRTALHEGWLKRWPKEPWTPGDYDVLAGGFKKRKFCFITTATCRNEGKPDDCAELTAFRAFRDGWLTEHGGEALIEKYYEIAPAIVTCIDLCDDGKARYAEVRERWLTPCYEALREERYADCRDTYVDMVRTLESRYLQ